MSEQGLKNFHGSQCFLKAGVILDEQRDQPAANDSWAHTKFLRGVHEIMFSINIAFTSVSLLFLAWPTLSRPFINMEVATNRLLQIRQTDLIRGYFEFGIASTILAFCCWLALRLSSTTRLTSEILQSVAGIATILALPVFWFYVSQQGGWSLGWRDATWLVEVAVALLCVLLFLYQRFPVQGWLCVLLVMGHYAFWFWIRENIFLASSAGPIAPIIGFFSTLAWGVYVKSLRTAGIENSPLRRSEIPGV